MASFEEDVKFANKILRVRDALANGELQSKPGIRCFSREPGVNEYSFYIEYEGTFVFAYRETRVTPFPSVIVTNDLLSAISFYSESDDIKTSSGLLTITEPEIYDEALHFQHSLVYDAHTLTSLVIYNALKCSPDDSNYFQLRLRYVDYIIKKLDGV